MQRDFGILLLPIVAVLAFLVPAVGIPRAQPQPPSAADSTDSAGSGQAHAQGDTARTLLESYGFTERRARQCLIATIPDPIDAANVSYTFDRYVDAIQRAMETAGYVLDRSDLPWLDHQAAEQAARTRSWRSDPAAPRFRREPGRLLFRVRAWAGKELPDTALVFLVGEAPTSGIQMPQFLAAVNELTDSCDPTEKIAVLGPSFSGSQVSLRDVMRQAAKRFTVVSGSATAVEAERFREDKHEYRTTIAPDRLTGEQFAQHLIAHERQRKLRLPAALRKDGAIKIGLLVEGTAYGSSAGSRRRDDVEIIRLPFPLHVASLRTAAVRTEAPTGPATLSHAGHHLTSLDLREARATRTLIPLTSPLETASIDMALATLLETLDSEQVRYVGIVATDVRDRIFLAQEIRHHLPNTVLFTQSVDLLYVHPDVNLDLRGTQVISSYPLFSLNQGWTTPVDPETHQALVTPPRLLFPTHTTQGVYNAALALIGHGDKMQEYSYPLQPDRPPAVWLSIVGSNEVWPVAILGDVSAASSVMVPRPRAPDGAGAALHVNVRTETHPWLAVAILLVAVLPAAYVLANFAGARVQDAGSPRLFQSGALGRLFSDTVFDRHKFARLLYLFGCCSALFSMYLLTTTIFALPWIADGPGDAFTWLGGRGWLLLRGAMVVGLLPTGGAVVLLFARILTCPELWEYRRRGECSRRWLAVVAVGGGAIGVLAMTVAVCLRWILGANEAPAEALFLYLRATDFGNGVSPLVPFVLIGTAAVAWGVSALRRLRLLEPAEAAVDTAPRVEKALSSFLGFTGRSFEGIQELERAVVKAIGRGTTDSGWPAIIGLVVMVVLAWIRLFGPRGVPSVEGGWFDALFALSFLAVYVALALSVLRFVVVWRRLRQLLHRLAWHPTVGAYARLASKIPGKPNVNLTTGTQVMTALEFSVDRAGKLVAIARALLKTPPAGAGAFTAALRNRREALETGVAAAEEALHTALKAEADGKWRTATQARVKADISLAAVTRGVVDLLRPAWRLPALEAPEAGEKKPDELQWQEYGEDFLASRVAAFLSHVVPQLQNLVVFVTGGLLLMLAAVTSYPFQPRELLLLFNAAAILTAVASTLVVFVQMERETILSVLADSEPGHVTWNRDFLSRIAVYILLPILSLIGAQFPEAAQQVFAWTSSFFGTH